VTLAPVVLAAGASRRLGHPKALADLGGQSALCRLLAALGGLQADTPSASEASGRAVAERPLVITGHHDREIRAHLQPATLDAELAFNPDWSAGRTSSVALAARLRPGSDLLVCPVDVPLVGSALMRHLAEEWHQLGAPPLGWLAPYTCPRSGQERRYGHPLILGAKLAEQAAALEPDTPLRVLRVRAAPLASVESADTAILDDLDTEADLKALRQRL